jgi:two-component system, OmpR family, response regulator VanR
MRVLVVEDEPYMAEAIRDGLRLEAIAADIAGDGGTALELLSVNAYDIAVLDRDIPGPSGDEVAESIVASGRGHACSQGSRVLLARMRFSIRRR